MPLEIRYRLNVSDLLSARGHVRERARTQAGNPRLLVIGGGVAFSLSMLLRLNGSAYPMWVWAVAASLFIASAIWLRASMRTGAVPRWLEQVAGEYALSLTAAGICLRMPDGEATFHAWQDVVALEATDAGLYLYLGRDAAFWVPRASAEDPGVEAVAGEVRRLWAAHPENAGRSLPAIPAGPSWARQAWANLRAAARLVFLCRFDAHAFRVSHGALVWLLLAHLVWLAVLDYLQALPSPQFSDVAVSDFGAAVLAILAWAAAVSRMMARRATLLRLLVMVTASALVIDLIVQPLYLAAGWWLPEASGVARFLDAFVLLWMAAAVFRIARSLYRQPAPAALRLASGFSLFVLAAALLLPQPHFYYRAEADETAVSTQAANLNVEDVFYRQPELVAHALAGVKPAQANETGLYFVGFAGDGSEREFGNEVRYARDLLDRRFNTAGHSLVLINRPETVNAIPLASAHNLETVLQGVARRMDRRRDVLFMFLSSHGAADHRLAVSMGPLGLDDLKAERLKEMLDRSGIRNRVIVVSACYSGGFLDVLKDDNTLILTASRRDHVAYGCGDVSDYTYFGEAYFVDALEHSDSFIGAFDEARREIAEREESEGADPSGPQIHVGRNIKRVLQRLKVAPAAPQADACDTGCTGESG